MMNKITEGPSELGWITITPMGPVPLTKIKEGTGVNMKNLSSHPRGPDLSRDPKKDLKNSLNISVPQMNVSFF